MLCTCTGIWAECGGVGSPGALVQPEDVLVGAVEGAAADSGLQKGRVVPGSLCAHTHVFG